MIGYKKVVLLILLLFFPFCVYAQPAAEQLKVILANLHSMQAHFSQTVYDGNGRIIQQSSGSMTLQRPGLFRWETQQPSRQLLIADGHRLWFYDMELEQVTVQKQHAINQNSPALLLSGSDTQLTQDFVVTELNATQRNEQVFRLVPKENAGLFQSLQLAFINKQLLSMQLMDSLGQMTRINFNKVRLNQSLSPRLFHFVVPPGVDVVKEG